MTRRHFGYVAIIGMMLLGMRGHPVAADSESREVSFPPPPMLSVRYRPQGEPWEFGGGDTWRIGELTPVTLEVVVSGLDDGGPFERPIRAGQFFLEYAGAACDVPGAPAFAFGTIEPGGADSPFVEEAAFSQTDPAIGEPGEIAYAVGIPGGEEQSACDNVLATITFNLVNEGTLVVWFRDPSEGEPTYLAYWEGLMVGTIEPPELVLSHPDAMHALTITLDYTPPVFVSCPADVVIGVGESIDPAINPSMGIATAEDNCDLVPDVEYEDYTVPGYCGEERTIVRTWIATDDCGNIATCVQFITIGDWPDCNDNGVPDACDTDCDRDGEVDACESSPPSGSPGPPRLSVEYIETGELWESSVGDRQWCLSSRYAIEAGLRFSVRVAGLDPSGPEERLLRSGQFFVEYVETPCDGGGAAFEFESIEPGGLGEVEPFGEDVSPFQVFTLSSHSLPDPGVSPGEIGCGVAIPEDQLQSACDNALASFTFTPRAQGRLELWFKDPAVDEPAMLTRMWGSPLSPWPIFPFSLWPCPEGAECSLELSPLAADTHLTILLDWRSPTLSCQPDTTASVDEGACEALVQFESTAQDTCTDTVVSHYIESVPGSGEFDIEIESPHVFPVGVTTVQCRAADQCGNTRTGTFTVTVNDDVAPSVMCPGNMQETSDPGECQALVQWPPAEAIDNCDGDLSDAVSYDIDLWNADLVDVTDWAELHYVFPVGEHRVIAKATDASGNTGICDWFIRVDDEELPSIDCPADIEQENEPGECGAYVTVPQPTASDNCGIESVMNDYNETENASDFYPVGMTVVTWTATDIHDNIKTCTHTIKVWDEEPPTIDCPENDSYPNDAGECKAAVEFAPEADDNCEVASVICQPPSGYAFPVGETTVECTAADPAGNEASCFFDITVEDVDPPVVTEPDPTLLDCSEPLPPCAQGIQGFLALAGADVDDNCTEDDALSVTSCEDQPIIGDDCDGVITRVYEIKDEAENTALAYHDFEIADTILPEADQGSIDFCYETLAEAGEAAMNATTNPRDNCTPSGEIEKRIHSSVGDCDAVIIVVIEDACGNQRFFTYDTSVVTSCEDCDSNWVPDSCEMIDCDNDGVLDRCQVPPIGTGSDCNGNLIPDVCEVPPLGMGADCDGSGVPDECEPDIDGDLLIDACEDCPYDPMKTEAGRCGCGVSEMPQQIHGWGYDTALCHQTSPPSPNDFVAVAGGGDCGTAIRANGSIVQWGCCTGSPPSGHDFIAISCGVCHCLALKDSDGDGMGQVVGWGCNTDGQIVVPTGDDFIAIGAGGYHSLAVHADGTVEAWGQNFHGQTDVPAECNHDVIAVAAGGGRLYPSDFAFSLALIDEDGDGCGELCTWGTNFWHLIDDTPEGDHFVAIACGDHHGMAIEDADCDGFGSVVCWGDAEMGQCDVPAGEDFVAIAGGALHSLAIRAEPGDPLHRGTVIGWGYNLYHQAEPSADLPLCRAVAAGRYFSLALTDGCDALLGDMNCDGVVDMDDVPLFITAIVDPWVYIDTHPICNINRANMNADDRIDGRDMSGFVTVLLQS